MSARALRAAFGETMRRVRAAWQDWTVGNWQPMTGRWPRAALGYAFGLSFARIGRDFDAWRAALEAADWAGVPARLVDGFRATLQTVRTAWDVWIADVARVCFRARSGRGLGAPGRRLPGDAGRDTG